MSAWGNKDSKTATGTIAITKNADGLTGNVAGTSTLFGTEALVGDTIVMNGNNFVITSISSNTAAKVIFGITGANVVAQSSGSYALAEKPSTVVFAEASENKSATSIYGNLEKTVGVSADEAIAARAAGLPRPAHAGWNRRIEGTGGRAGRVSYETLVAMGSITGDANDDDILPDYALAFTVQPENASGNSAADETVTFEVDAASVPSGASISYLWQYTSTPGDANTFVTTVGVSGFSGQTSNTLSVNTAVIDDGTILLAIASANGAANVSSDPAILTVTT